MRLVEQDLVDLDDDRLDLVPQLPAHHSHTVGDLLSNRGCVGHYNDIPGGFGNQDYPSALAAAQQFWDEPLVCTPPSPYYSTHGYTLLGAGLEAAAGDDIESLVRAELTDAYDLGSLAPQDLGDDSVRRMTIYTADDREVAIPDNDWKTLGGGIDSSAYGLGRFGAKLAAGQVLTGARCRTCGLRRTATATTPTAGVPAPRKGTRWSPRTGPGRATSRTCGSTPTTR